MKLARRLPLRLAGICTLALGVSVAVAAQKAEPLRITFEHDGEGVSGFALYVQPDSGEALRFDLGLVVTDRSGRRTMSLPFLANGTYRLSVAAYNGAGESARVPASPARIVVKTQPAKNLQDAHADHAAASPPAAAPAPPPAAAPSDRAREGGLGRLWRILVGED